MRTTSSNGKVLMDGKTFVGINLGADFVSEHECGVKELLKKFNCDEKKKGLHSRKITVAPYKVLFPYNKDDKQYTILTSDLNLKIENIEIGKVFSDEGINFFGSWSENNFLLGIEENVKSSIVESLKQAFDKKDIAISIGGSMPFSNGGLNLLIYSNIPKKIMQESVKKQEEHENAESKLHNSKEYKKLLAKKEEWRTKYQSSNDTPYSYIALSPSFHNGKFQIWLNPSNQQHLMYGWLSLKDIDDWAEGKVGKVIPCIEAWEELKYITSAPYSAWSVPYYRKNWNHFQGYPNNDYKFPKQKYPKYDFSPMSEDMIKNIEMIIKYWVKDDIYSQMNIYGWSERKPSKEQIDSYFKDKKTTKFPHLRREAQDLIFGFFRALTFSNYGSFEAINTPESRSNFSWWKSQLERECEYEIAKDSGYGFQPWEEGKFYQKSEE